MSTYHVFYLFFIYPNEQRKPLPKIADAIDSNSCAAVITQDSACIWTDGRYTLQASASAAYINTPQILVHPPAIS